MIWFFAALALVFFFGFIWTVMELRSEVELSRKQAERLLETVRLAAHWQQRALDAERIANG